MLIDLRRCSRVIENTAVLQVLDIRTVLKVFLERIAALNGGDRALIHLEVRLVFFEWIGHGCRGQCVLCKEASERGR